MPFNEEEFYSLLYLDSRRPSSLLMGTSTARQTYMANLLRIHEFERVREYVKSRLSSLTLMATTRDAIADTLPKKPIKTDVLKTNLEKGEFVLSTTKTRLHEVSNHLDVRELYEEHRGDLKLARGFDLGEYRRMQNLESAWLMRVRQQSEYGAYLKARKKWRAKLKRLAVEAGWPSDKPITFKPLKSWFNRVTSIVSKNLAAAKETSKARWQMQDQLRALRRDKESAQYMIKSTFGDTQSTTPAALANLSKKLSKSLVTAQADVSRLLEKIEHLESHKGGGESACSVCGATLTQKRADKLLTDTKVALAFVPNPDVLSKKLSSLMKATAMWNKEKVIKD